MKQMDFIENKDLGYDRENIVVIDSLQDRYTHQRLDMIKSELLKNPAIVNVTGSFSYPGSHSGFSENFTFEGANDSDPVKMSLYYAYYDYFDFFDIDIIEGREFSREFPTDSTDALILNETAVRKMGLKSPIGTVVKSPYHGIEGKVIGVVSDIHAASLHNEILPTVYKYFNLKFYYSVKIRPQDISGTLQFLEDKWKDFAPGKIFNYSFLNEKIAKQYKDDERTENVFRFSSFLAVFIACLGLLGLSIFTAETRIKEIGIRKVLGASAGKIVGILSSEIVKLVILSNIIAWPAAYFIMQRWLDNFAYRIDMEIWFFAAAGMLALLIAVFTISIQTIKAANANPANTLKYE